MYQNLSDLLQIPVCLRTECSPTGPCALTLNSLRTLIIKCYRHTTSNGQDLLPVNVLTCKKYQAYMYGILVWNVTQDKIAEMVHVFIVVALCSA